jgi:hypothetical protein
MRAQLGYVKHFNLQEEPPPYLANEQLHFDH